ncbi:death ligand signal enhancer isoform X2 [Lingula anatina]|uniref:Death ligand signal enhancer isoform X2 n=1 Tax=Lingula anatina TaxID=7574 RepID=A0A1S3HY71_LINAN|nr:death ligand signal enhancer isoform X2 [Lingula anatina]|eukprot:XP_013390958.1 death ligand signal enhancer isoform X2 [Lingula anatina]
MWKALKSFRKVLNNQFECASKTQGAAPLQHPFTGAASSEQNQQQRHQKVRRNCHTCKQYYRYFRRKARRSTSDKRSENCLGQGTEKEEGWQRWQSHTEFIASQPKAPNVLVGWGAILALGFHISKACRSQEVQHGKKTKKCPWHQMANTVPQGIAYMVARKNVAGVSGVKSEKDQQVLPEPGYLTEACKEFREFKDLSSSCSSGDEEVTQSSSLDKEFVDFAQFYSSFDKKFKDLTEDFDFVDSSTSKHSPFQADSDQSQTNSEPVSLEEAWAEFQGLSRTYSSVEENILALKHASEGNLEEATKHWQTAAQEAEYASAHFNLGVCYEHGKGVEKSIEKAFNHYQVAASGGHAKAAYNLAVLYLEGHGVEQNTNKALSLLEKAAEHGISQAQTELGAFYTEEENKDLKRAASLFELAAKQKDPDGQFCLGVCYEQGWGVEQNECKAAELYRKAAKSGHDGAQYNLGVYFESGRGGLPVSNKSAIELYEQAANAGNADAKHNLDRLLTLEALDLVTSNITATTEAKEPSLNKSTSCTHISSQASQLSLASKEDLGLQVTKKDSRQNLDEMFSVFNIREIPKSESAVLRPVFQLGASEDDCVTVMKIYQNRSSIHSNRLDIPYVHSPMDRMAYKTHQGHLSIT